LVGTPAPTRAGECQYVGLVPWAAWRRERESARERTGILFLLAKCLYERPQRFGMYFAILEIADITPCFAASPVADREAILRNRCRLPRTNR
jgi:hypothetical protein